MAPDSSVRNRKPRRRSFVRVRILAAAIAGLVVGDVVGVTLCAISVAPTAGWIAFTLVFLATTWHQVGRMDARTTAIHATREDPTVRAGDAILTVVMLLTIARTSPTSLQR